MFLCDVDIRDIQLKREKLRSRGFKKTSFRWDTCSIQPILKKPKKRKRKEKEKTKKCRQDGKERENDSRDVIRWQAMRG